MFFAFQQKLSKTQQKYALLLFLGKGDLGDGEMEKSKAIAIWFELIDMKVKDMNGAFRIKRQSLKLDIEVLNSDWNSPFQKENFNYYIKTRIEINYLIF